MKLFLANTATSPCRFLYPEGSFVMGSFVNDDNCGDLGMTSVEFPERPEAFVRALATKIDGVWVGSWEPVTLELLDSEAVAMRVRVLRNQMLAASDWTQVVDAQVDQQAWATYRQALRDVSSQPGFPENVEWPVAP